VCNLRGARAFLKDDTKMKGLTNHSFFLIQISPFEKGGLRGIFMAVPAFFKGHCYILPLFLKELQIFPPFVKGARGILC